MSVDSIKLRNQPICQQGRLPDHIDFFLVKSVFVTYICTIEGNAHVGEIAVISMINENLIQGDEFYRMTSKWEEVWKEMENQCLVKLQVPQNTSKIG